MTPAPPPPAATGTPADACFDVSGLCCQDEVRLVGKRLARMHGVNTWSADLVARRVQVRFDPAATSPAAIARAIGETGLSARELVGGEDGTRVAADRPAPAVPRTVWLALLSALGLAAGAIALWVGAPGPVAASGFAVAIVTAGIPTAWRAWQSVKLRSLDIHVLMVVAVTGAVVLGEYFEAATVVFLFALAQWLEGYSVERARRAIRSLMASAPREAVVVREGVEIRLPIARVRVGDTVRVRPGETIALDGEVTDGVTEVDQAPVTGESTPVSKDPGDVVYAGTINGTGAIDLRVTRAGQDSTIARVIRLVEQAQSQRAPAQAFVDRFARVYTPIVIGLAVAVAFVPPLVLGQPVADWVYRALVLLVISCPCALVIATPVSIVSALAAAARRGVLIKGGLHLERTGGVRCVAIDKTGTLTRGELEVKDVVAFEPVTRHEVIGAAATIESRSEHPIGRAILRHAGREGVDVGTVDGFRAIPGRGAEATVNGRAGVLGNHRLFEERQLCTDDLHDHLDDLAGRGRTPVMLALDGEAVGVLGVADEVRAHVRDAVAQLRAHGVRHVVMLTGDHHATARAIAAEVGVDEFRAELLPEDKVLAIQQLRAVHGPVAMIGDGINDAPALAAADVGIAMGAAGSHAALETADVALMADELLKVPFAIRLGRRALAFIRFNVAFAIGVKAVFLVLALSGNATLWMAVVADTGASLVVVANALRLLRAS
jgi:Cd2+/Zn2+-exporting ATPase